MSGQLLQCSNDIGHRQEIRIWECVGLRQFGQHKIAHSRLVHCRDELMPIVLCTLDGKKKAALGKNDLAAIQQ